MIFDVVGSIFETTVPLSDIGNQQMLDYTFSVLVEVLRELNLSFQNLLIDCHRIVIIEWIDSRNHFVGQNT